MEKISDVQTSYDRVAAMIHFPRTQVAGVLTEIKRVLRPGGLLLLAFHIGDDILHLDDWWGHQVSLDFVLFRPDEMTGFLELAGFQIEEMVEREPYPEVEHQSRRAYVFATRGKADHV